MVSIPPGDVIFLRHTERLISELDKFTETTAVPMVFIEVEDLPILLFPTAVTQ